MSARGPSGGKTADELVEALLDQDEYRAVLRYALDNGLHKDDTVLFMVGMLKVFAYVWDRLGELARILDLRVESFREETRLAEERLAETVGDHVKLLHKIMDDHVKLIGHSAGQINFAAGEMKVLHEQMTLVTLDAKRTLAALQAFKGAPNKASFTNLIDERMTAALVSRATIVDETFQERMLGVIYRGMDQFILRTRIHIIMIVALAAVVIYFVRRWR